MFKKYGIDSSEVIEAPRFSSFKKENLQENDFSLLDLIQDQSIKDKEKYYFDIL